jgi:hypothetical protein
VQDATNAQSYNRYAYGLNNPLAYTDPSGYFNLGRALTHAWKSVWENPLGRTAVAITAAYFTGYFDWGTALGSSASIGIFGSAGIGNTLAAGFVAGGVQSGTFNGAAQGLFSAALFFGAGELGGGVIQHAVAGCISGVAAGGKCGPGALSAGFAEFAGHVLPLTGDFVGDLIARMVAGGTASVIGGGKFDNGAFTGAFGYLFNCLQHECAAKFDPKEDAIESVCPECYLIGAGGFIKAGVESGIHYMFRISEAGLAHAERHLFRVANGVMEAPEIAMLDRLKSGLRTIQDVTFYRHEIIESLLVRVGVPARGNIAHNMTLFVQGIPRGIEQNLRLYHPSVIRENIESFSFATRRALGIQ